MSDISTQDGDNAVDANKIGSSAIIEAAGLLGDQWSDIVGMVMHSVPFRRLQILGLIETEPVQDQTIAITRYLGREVLVDDGMPKVAGTTSGFRYTTYLFGAGAVAMGEKDLPTEEAVEVARDAPAGNNYLMSRRHMLIHVRGVAWIGTAVDATPSIAELETSSNWAKRFEDKNVSVLSLITN